MKKEHPDPPAADLRLPRWLLLLAIFVTGNVVMMLEVIGTRVVGPFFGVGLYVWSALITVTLLALAGGYWAGGKLADRRAHPRYLFLIIFLAGILTLLIPLERNPVLIWSTQWGFRPGTLCGSAILFGPVLFLLGMVTPFAAKLYTDRFEALGSRVGFLYSVSTLGSFAGTLTMGFYLIPTFRLSRILLSLGIVLLLLPLGFFWLRPRLRALLLVALGLLGASVWLSYSAAFSGRAGAGPMKIVHKSTSLYGEIKVVDIGDNRLLLLDGVSQSGDNRTTHGNLPAYVLDLETLLRRFCPRARRVLLIGLGGGNLVHGLQPHHLQLDIVEIDPKIVAVARDYFGVDPAQAAIHIDDGRRYVRQTREQYDAVIMNAFTGESTPVHLLNRDFFREARAVLNPGGIMLINFVGYVQGPQRQGAAAVYATLRSAWQWSRIFFRGPKDRFGNILFVAGDAPEPPAPDGDEAWQKLLACETSVTGWEKARVCTDDYNPVDFLNREVYRRWRQSILETMGPEILLN